MVHCGLNNFDHNEPKGIVDAFFEIGKVFQEKSVANVNIVFISLEKSKERNKFLKVNDYLKKSCKYEIIGYLEQYCNWVHKDQLLNTSLYYKDYLCLIELGNDKVAATLVKMITNLNCKNSPLTPSSSSKSISLSSPSSIPPSLALPSAL